MQTNPAPIETDDERRERHIANYADWLRRVAALPRPAMFNAQPIALATALAGNADPAAPDYDAIARADWDKTRARMKASLAGDYRPAPSCVYTGDHQSAFGDQFGWAE